MSDIGQLQDDLDNMIRWFKENNLQLHDNMNKFKLASHHQIPYFHLPIVMYEALSCSAVPSRQYVTLAEGLS